MANPFAYFHSLSALLLFPYIPQILILQSYKILFYVRNWYNRGYMVAQSVKALRYKPDGRVFDSRWCQLEFFSVALELTQPVTEMSTRNVSWG
jgi:hypothetical protein